MFLNFYRRWLSTRETGNQAAEYKLQLQRLINAMLSMRRVSLGAECGQLGRKTVIGAVNRPHEVCLPGWSPPKLQQEANRATLPSATRGRSKRIKFALLHTFCIWPHVKFAWTASSASGRKEIVKLSPWPFSPTWQGDHRSWASLRHKSTF
jgi:hypothetical protein